MKSGCQLNSWGFQSIYSVGLLFVDPNPVRGIENLFILIMYGFFLIGIIAIVIISAKFKFNWKQYLLAGLVMYVVSFLGSWSIGLYLLVFPFILLILAFAQRLGYLKNNWQLLLFIGLGTILWYFSINHIDDAWLFFPFSWLI